MASLLSIFAFATIVPVSADDGSAYVPERFWERRLPESVGMDTEKLDEAIAYALDHESSAPVNLRKWLEGRLEDKRHNEILGPMRERSGINGMIIRHGYLVAYWGDTRRVDMTFSVTKSMLSTLAGLAVARGHVAGLDARAAETVPGLFDDPHNAPITWRHLLSQTSEWQGTLWDKPDSADRRRGMDRELEVPGTFWEYNDVRVNAAALALLHAWRKPLPDVLRDEVMTPIGASNEWQWHGYRNSRVEIDDRWTTSVSGGGHWGGGLWISSRDLARLGLLYLRDGRWGDRQVLPAGWTATATTPTAVEPTYGLMWWLNTNRALWPSAPASSFAMLGGGGHAVWIDPEHDLVVVIRWLERGHLDGFLRRVLAALGEGAAVGEPSFADVTETALPVWDGDDADGGFSMDAAAFDADGDGDADVLVANEHRPNRLLLNDGTGRFVDASDRLPRVSHDSEDIAVGDFDGDGDPDVVVVSEDDEVDELLLNDGQGRFVAGGGLPAGGHANAVVSLDLDGDGDLDLLVGQKGQNAAWLNNGQAGFADDTARRLPEVADTTQDLALGDVDGDGDLDCVVANEGANRLLLNDGEGVFVEAPLPMRAVPEETREVVLGDVDGDGDLDVFFANIRGFVADAEPRNRLLLNDGRGNFEEAQDDALPADQDRSFSAAMVDVDGDGDLDLVTANTAVGVGEDGRRRMVATPFRVYRNDGRGRFAEATEAVFPAGVVGHGFDIEIADFDGDGQQDLYLASRGARDRLLRARGPGSSP